jgi:hypothetical protein
MDTIWQLRRRLLAAAIGLTLTACSNLHSTYVPDGRRGFAITCGGVLSSASSCLVKAGRACGGLGYDTIKGNEDDRSMLIACKTSGGAIAAARPAAQ